MGRRGESYMRDGLRMLGTSVIRVIRYRRDKGTRRYFVLAFYHSILSFEVAVTVNM